MDVYHIEIRQTTLDPTDFHCMKTLINLPDPNHLLCFTEEGKSMC